MKTSILLLTMTILFAACSSPKKAPANPAAPTATRDDVLRGGTSFNNAVVIMVENERTGLDEQYKWLSNNYPGYTLLKRSQVNRSAKHYDIVQIKTRHGQVKNIYFDCTRMRKK